MPSWFQAHWSKFAASYDAPAAAVQSSPKAIVLGVGSLTLAILASGYVPALASISHLRAAYLPALLACGGAVCTYNAWRHQATGRIGTACMWMDTFLYTSALSLTVVLSEGPFAVGFAIALALFILGFPARVYALNWPIAVAMCGPPVVLTVALERDTLIGVIVWAACTLALTTSQRTGQRRALVTQNAELRSALGAADRLADQSMEAALTAALVDIGHFLHELRNVRAAQQANLQYVLEEGGLQGETRKAIEEAIASQTQENQLVAAAIDRLRRKGRPSQSDFVLHDVLREFAKAQAGPVRVTLALQAPRFLVRGNPEHVSAILQNLTRNSAKAGSTQVDILVKANSDSKSVILLVQDNGPGLRDDQLAGLFRPFPEGGRSDGTGLGLYLTRRYVDLLGGHIDASNREGGGAVFRMLLPGRLATDLSDPANAN